MGKQNDCIVALFKKGYNVIDGRIFRENKVEIKQYIHDKGYYYFTVRYLKKNLTIYVHKMVAYKKYGHKLFEPNIQVRHLDSNPINNLEENIGIGTPSENMMDKSPEVRMRVALIASSFAKKHNHEEILKMHNEGLSYRKIMEKTGIKSKGTISFIVKESMASKK